MSTAAVPDAPLAPGRARLRSYALWQMRDYLVNKGIATALILGLMLFLTWTGLREAQARLAQQGWAIMESTDLAPLIDLGFVELVDKIILFGVLFATNGIVSEDRKFGYYRFYFSKPVSVPAFYGQKFVVHVLGVLLIACVVLGVHALVIAPRFPREFLLVAAMAVIGLAGIGFLISAVFTLDWLSLFVVYGAAQVGWMVYGDDAGLRGHVVRALPPVHRLREVYTALVAGEPLPMAPLWWIFAYGVVCFFLGMVVLSRRRLATN